jgi:hypothetical protein
VIWARPPPSDARIMWMPFWLPSLLNVSQRSRVPSGDGVPQGFSRFGFWPPTSRKVPSSTLMIREPPPGESNAPPVAIWIPSGNHRGSSPVSVGPLNEPLADAVRVGHIHLGVPEQRVE